MDLSEVSSPHYRAAAEMYRHGKLDEAVLELKKAIDLEPLYLKAYNTLGAIYEIQKRFEEAKIAYRTALQIEIDDPRANYGLGVLLAREGHYSDALTPLRMAWSNDQKNPHVAGALAFALDKTDDYATAKIMYEAALLLDPKMSAVRFNLGTLHFHQKRFEAAIACYVTYMINVGDDSRAHRNIGKSLLQLGQQDSALSSFRRAAALDRVNPKNYYSIALIYDNKEEYEQAIAHYRRTLQLEPSHSKARYKLAKLLRHLERTDEAVEEFQELIRRDPNHYQGLNGLATCYLARNELVEAVGLLRQSADVAPHYSHAHYNLGVAMSRLANFEGAVFHFQEAARLDPTDDSAVAAAEQALNRTTIRYKYSLKKRSNLFEQPL